MKVKASFDYLTARFSSGGLFWITLLLVVQIVLYGAGIFNGFAGDDRTYFIDNDLYDQLRYSDFFRFFVVKTNYWGEHLPLRDYLNFIQKSMFSANPLPYHLISFIIFSFFILAVFKVFRTFNEDHNAKFICFISTAFYVSHPALVECVSYVSGQKDLLCAVFTVITVLLLVKYFQKRTFIILLFAGIFYYAALFSKLVAIVNILAVIVIYYFFNAEKNIYRDAVLWFFFNIPAFLWIFYSMFGGLIPPSAKEDKSILICLVNAVKIIGWQFYVMIKSYPRSFGYPYAENEIDIYFFAGLILLISLVVVFICSKNIFIKTGILLWFIFLVPVLRFISIVDNAGVYDRYLFLPLFGVAFIIYGILSQYKNSYLIFAIILLVSMNSLATFFSTGNFKDDIALSHNSYTAYPSWPRTSFDYAYSLIEGGRFEAAERLMAQEKALEKPSWVIPYFRGWIALERGELDAADDLLRGAALLAATGGYYPFPNIPLAKALMQKGEGAAADEFLRRVVVLGGKANPVEFFKAKTLLAH